MSRDWNRSSVDWAAVAKASRKRKVTPRKKGTPRKDGPLGHTGWGPPQTSPQAAGATKRAKPDQPERREQEAVKRLLTAMGAKFWVAGTVRRQGDHPGTMQTPGLPDLPLVFLPRRGQLGGGQPQHDYQLVVIEVKSPAAAKTKSGGLSYEQAGVRDLCRAAGVAYIHGDLDRIIQWLLDAGYLSPGQVPHYRLAPKD